MKADAATKTQTTHKRKPVILKSNLGAVCHEDTATCGWVLSLLLLFPFSGHWACRYCHWEGIFIPVHKPMGWLHPGCRAASTRAALALVPLAVRGEHLGTRRKPKNIYLTASSKICGRFQPLAPALGTDRHWDGCALLLMQKSYLQHDVTALMRAISHVGCVLFFSQVCIILSTNCQTAKSRENKYK